MPHVTITDIVKATGYSKSTVSAALNGKPGVSEKNRAYIVQTAKEMGYMPSDMARGLAMSQSYSIGVIVNDITNPFFNNLVKAIEHVADRYGYTLLLSNTDFSHKKEVNAVQTLLRKRVDGMIVTPLQCEVNLDHLREVQHYGIPLCSIGVVPGLEVYAVDQDDLQGTREVMKYLYGMGHRRIAHIEGPPVFTATEARREGYCRFLEEKKDCAPPLVLPGDASIQSGYEAGSRLEALEQKPTAVFCFDDQIAKGLFRYYREKGLRIPEHISIVGFNDSVDDSSILTTVHVPIDEMGRYAAEYFFSCLTDGRPMVPSTTIMPTSLTVRQSVRRI
ncbi:LacI family transcriptional regulator [Ruminococcaceae bacterium OttesenSCG-928-I18]|nr:LacI family transcriptional regulator [Ruminococcaceae bacterium OttesenSCG-928-I18]